MPMQSIPKLLGITLLYFCSVVDALSEEQWKLEDQTSDISLFSRETDTGHIEVKAVTQVDANFKAIMLLLDDIDAAPHWISHCRKVESLGWFGAKERKVHTFFSSPWPLSDRDMVIYSIATINEQERSLSIKVEDRGREQQILSHYVRMQNVSGTWNSKSLENGRTEVSYIGYGEPAGSVPAWLANKLLISSTMETFTNMRKLIGAKKYQGTK